MISVRKSDAACGAEVLGVDLSQDIDDETFGKIVDIWHEHEVVFFRNQSLTPAQHVDFSRRFGELECHVRSDVCRPGHPEILIVSNVFENGKPIGSQDAGLFWHSDLCYKAEPSRGSLLYAREVPVENGRALGHTRFASMTAAYEALPDATKRSLEGLRVVNSYMKAYHRDRKSGERKPLSEAQMKQVPDVMHPAVRAHPFTGRKCIFMNEGYTRSLVDASGAPGPEGLLDAMLEQITQPRFVYKHEWQVGDLVIWDNCSTQHCATADYKLPLRRIMDRTTLRGTPTS